MQQQIINGNNTGINGSNEKSNERFQEMFYEGVKLLKKWKSKNTNTGGDVDVLDFFSGCGGMSLGFAAISQNSNLFNIIGGIDLSEYALKSFEKNYKAKTLQKDIREIYTNGEYQQIKDYFGIKEKR